MSTVRTNFKVNLSIFSLRLLRVLEETYSRHLHAFVLSPNCIIKYNFYLTIFDPPLVNFMQSMQCNVLSFGSTLLASMWNP